MKSVRACSALLMFVLSVSAIAALSKEYAEFAKGPADFLMTKEERKQWKSIKTDEEAQAFVERFWARRDPTPATPQNEFRLEFEARVKAADLQFHSTRGPGSKSDRGKIFILMGPPTLVRKTNAIPSSTIQTPTSNRPKSRALVVGVESYSPKEVWEYQREKTATPLPQPVVQIGFIDQYGTDDWKIERVPLTDLSEVLKTAAAANIKQADANAH